MDIKYINKVVEDIFVEGISKLEIKTEVYKRLDKELTWHFVFDIRNDDFFN